MFLGRPQMCISVDQAIEEYIQLVKTTFNLKTAGTRVLRNASKAIRRLY